MSKFREHPLKGNYDIDSAFTNGWIFYKRWFVPLYSVSFVMSVIVATISGNVDLASLQNTADPAEMLALVKPLMGVYALTTIISLFFNTLIQYFIINRPLEPDFNFVDALGKVLVKYYLPLLVVFIILGVMAFFAMILGVLLLFIGILFAVPYAILFFAMATPVMMIENRGIGDTITRLIKLVHKRFWQNMGWISVYILLIVFFSFIIGAIVMIPFSGNMLKSLFNPDSASQVLELANNPLYLILSSLASAITVPVMPILGLILYFNNSDSDADSIDDSGSPKGKKVKVEDLYADRNNDSFSPTVDDLRP